MSLGSSTSQQHNSLTSPSGPFGTPLVCDRWTDRLVTAMCLFNSLLYMGLAADTFFFHPLKDTGFEVRGGR